MKKIVLEALASRELTHIFSEKQFKSYYKKVTKNNNGNNQLAIAYNILDMFILNG